MNPQSKIIRLADKQAGARKMATRVLCLVDCEKAQENLRVQLSTTYEVSVAPTILRALQDLKKEVPELIVLQLHLRDEDCFDFLRTLKNNSEYSKIPIITCCVDDVFDPTIEEFLKKVANFWGSKIYFDYAHFYSENLCSKIIETLSLSCLHRAS